jgi:hypothetical protein
MFLATRFHGQVLKAVEAAKPAIPEIKNAAIIGTPPSRPPSETKLENHVRHTIHCGAVSVGFGGSKAVILTPPLGSSIFEGRNFGSEVRRGPKRMIVWGVNKAVREAVAGALRKKFPHAVVHETDRKIRFSTSKESPEFPEDFFPKEKLPNGPWLGQCKF